MVAIGQGGDPDEVLRKLREESQAQNQAARRQIKIIAPAARGADVGTSQKIVIPSGDGVLTLEISQTGAASKLGPQPPQAARSAQSSNSAAGRAALAVMILAGLYLVIFLVQRKGKEEQDTEIIEPVALSQNFSIVRRIGEGGMGVVYEALDRSLNRKVAVKKMRDDLKRDSADYDHFLKEAKTVAALHHPHIVDIHSIVTQGGETYLVFEFVEGKTVSALLRERNRLSLKEVKLIFQPICLALEFAHGRSVIHRDLKPSNVMITAQGFVKIMDFGLARQLKSAPVKPSRDEASYHLTGIAGTPAYMAPEAELGVVYPQSDIYSLGVMAYEMLAGELPFSSSEIPVAEQKLSRAYQRLSQKITGLPSGLDGLIDQTLEPDPMKRLRTPRQFWDGLAPLA